MKSMTDLVAYGIQDEKADLRAHVCVVARCVYTYPTFRAREQITKRKYLLKPAYQNGIKTAEGYLVPPDDIPGCRPSRLSDLYWDTYCITEDMDTREKGERAAQLVADALRAGRIAFPLYPRVVREYDLQLIGFDIVANANISIQVKCDFKGGHRHLGGTGNLYIQVAEANPHKLY
jgi:hypothetical protein